MKSIYTSIKVLATIGIASLVTSTSVRGQLVTVDEFGKGNFNGTGLPSAIAVEPISGIATLMYTLPFVGTPGDVVLLEPGTGPQQTSDILRFDGQGNLYFFSEREA